MPEINRQRPLFDRFPALRRGLPLLGLADLPTPVRALSTLGEQAGVPSLWLKDDGQCSPHYGGNKVRKLELVLAAARAEGASQVLTFGYAGSNHATATAVHAARAGMRSISILLPQENAPYLRKNLLVSAAAGAEIHEYPSRRALYVGTALTMLRHRLRNGRKPYVISPGGSSPLGTIGLVNAAFELAEQVSAGVLPRPHTVYAAAGTLGTVVGLALGFAALEWPTRVVAVRVVDPRFVDAARVLALWRRTNALLVSNDARFPELGDPGDRIAVRGEFFGETYARETPASKQAATLALELEGLALDPTYTAKAMACLLADAAAGVSPDGPTLFWNTCNSSDISASMAAANAADLPRRLQRYFNDADGPFPAAR